LGEKNRFWRKAFFLFEVSSKRVVVKKLWSHTKDAQEPLQCTGKNRLKKSFNSINVWFNVVSYFMKLFTLGFQPLRANHFFWYEYVNLTNVLKKNISFWTLIQNLLKNIFKQLHIFSFFISFKLRTLESPVKPNYNFCF